MKNISVKHYKKCYINCVQIHFNHCIFEIVSNARYCKARNVLEKKKKEKGN